MEKAAVFNFPPYTMALWSSQVSRAMNRYLSRTLEKSMLSPTEYMLLGLLKNHKNLQASELANFMNIKPPVVTVMLHHLLELKLVRKELSASDKRFRVITLSAKGAQLLNRLEKKIHDDFTEFTAGMNSADIDAYCRILEQFSHKLLRRS